MYRVLSTARTHVAVDPSFQAGFLGGKHIRDTVTTKCQHSETELPELKGKCPTFKMDGFFNMCFFFFKSDFIKL